MIEIWAIGAKADAEVYAEATARLIDVAGRLPEFSKLADVVDRLGRLAGDVDIAREPEREPVPDRPAERLIHSVGMAPHDVAALSLEQAVDCWGRHTSRPQ